MNENLNLIEILENVPKGTKLWSPICGDCYFQRIIEGSSSPIFCTAMLVNGDYGTIYFTEEGLHFNKFTDGGCVLFPSKTNHDWSKFEVPKKHKEFEPFQKVLCVADNNHDCEVWSADFYSHYDKSTFEHYLVSGFVKADDEIIPYEDNEDKLGKTVEGIK